MASTIDATKPEDNANALTSDLRNNLQAAKDEIETLQAGKLDTALSEVAAFAVLKPGPYSVNTSGGAVSLQISNDSGVIKLYNPSNTWAANNLSVGNATQTYRNAAGAVVPMPLVLSEDGKAIELLSDGNGHFEVVTHDVTYSSVVTPSTEVVVMESFDDFSSFSSSGGVFTDDAINTVEGLSAIKLVNNNASTGSLIKNDFFVGKVADLGVIAYYQDTGDNEDPDYQTMTGVSLRLGRGNYNYVQGVTQPNNLAQDTLVHTGGFWHAYHYSENPNISGLADGDVDMRVIIGSETPHTSESHIDAMLTNAAGIPTVTLFYDDAISSHYTEVFPYLESKGIKGNFVIPTDYLGAAGKMTIAQVKEIDDAGHNIVLNLTASDAPISSSGHTTVADVIADLDAQVAILKAGGISDRAFNHVVYPNGQYQINGTKIQISTVTLNSTAVIVMADTTGITVGMKAVCRALPIGTRVLSVDSGTNVTVDQNATETSADKGVRFVDDSGAFHMHKLQNGMKAAGYEYGYTTTAAGDPSPTYSKNGVGGRALFLPRESTSGKNLAGLQSAFDKTKLRGSTFQPYIHGLVASGATGLNMLITTHEEIIDYIVDEKAAGRLTDMTLSEWVKRDIIDVTHSISGGTDSFDIPNMSMQSGGLVATGQAKPNGQPGITTNAAGYADFIVLPTDPPSAGSKIRSEKAFQNSIVEGREHTLRFGFYKDAVFEAVNNITLLQIHHHDYVAYPWSQFIVQIRNGNEFWLEYSEHHDLPFEDRIHHLLGTCNTAQVYDIEFKFKLDRVDKGYYELWIDGALASPTSLRNIKTFYAAGDISQAYLKYGLYPQTTFTECRARFSLAQIDNTPFYAKKN